MNFKRRVARLKKELDVSMEVRRMRIVCTTVLGVSDDGDGPRPSWQAEQKAGLQSCTRHLSKGWIFETVWINGSDETISDDEINAYVESFAIGGLPPNQKFGIAARK